MTLDLYEAEDGEDDEDRDPAPDMCIVNVICRKVRLELFKSPLRNLRESVLSNQVEKQPCSQPQLLRQSQLG